MIKAFNLSLLFFLSVLINFSFSQSTNTEQIEVDVQITYANHIGTTPPLRHLIPVPQTDLEKRKKAKNNRKAPDNFRGRGKNNPYNPNAQPQGADPVRQPFAKNNANMVIEPLVNIEGLSSSFGSPHDPTGDIGRDHYLQAINATQLGVFDKEGNLIGNSFAANTIWSSIGFSSAGDPIILYDQEVNRWIITEFPNGNQLLVAVSQNSDPLGSWDAYNFGTPNFPDYPKYGVWSNAYSVTTNEGGNDLPTYYIDKAALLNGEDVVMIQRITLPNLPNSPGFFVATPVDWSGLIAPPADQGPIVLRLNDDAWSNAGEDKIDVYSINLDWDNPDNTTVTNSSVVTAPYDTNPCSVPGFGLSCVPQAGNGGGLDGLPEIILNQAHYRNFETHETLVFTFIVDATAGQDLSGMRWMEFRRLPGEDWTVYQEGTYAPDDGLDRYAGSIAMDRKGSIALAYAASSENEFVSLRFTGRLATDPLGEMTVEEYIITEGTNTINSNGRFSDYAHMSIDPLNDRTFWFTGEYGGGGNGLSTTRIVAFDLRKDTTDISPTTILSPQSAPDLTDNETIQIEVKNLGLDTPSVFNVGYIFEDQPMIVEEVNVVLYPDSIYLHTFTPTIDISVVGSYNLKTFTSLSSDEVIANDTLRTVISKLPRWDTGISAVDGLGQTLCSDSTEIALSLTNFGTLPLASVNVIINLNGEAFDTIQWAGNLPSGMTEAIVFGLTGMVEGQNEISVFTALPNGEVDEITDNDGFSRIFAVLPNGVSISLELETDFYPGETTWEIEDEGGHVIYAGGPYEDQVTLIIEELCLDPEACYTFTIFDAYGDGICCNYGIGSYALKDENGLPLLVSNGQFGTQETNNFCATFVCMLEVDVASSPESAIGTADGAILITVSNGIEPFQYSIDGGTTFQASNMFGELSAGDYNIVVQSAANCLIETLATITTCALDILAEALNESAPNAGDGSISITASNGQAPFSYSINDGTSFQDSSHFNSLLMGVYPLVVRDALGCEATLEVIIDIQTDTDEQFFGQAIEVFPNPTNGIFRINVNGLGYQGAFLHLEILDASGKRIQNGNLVIYDSQYTGLLSLVAFPAGVYYVRFLHEEVKRMVQVVKQ